jgi:agmatinase
MAFYYAKAGLAESQIVIVGMPLDRTSSFNSGTRFGADIARLGADNIETFSPYLMRDVAAVRVCDSGNLEFCYDKPSAPLDLIAAATRANYDACRRQVAIGGEHTVTPAIISELVTIFPDLCVIQYDAHSDLRDSYLGESNCHATAMRRVLDVIPRHSLFQLGIRSFAERKEMDEQNVYPFEVISPAPDIRSAIGARPVYITLDIDVLDPGVMPDVQTPQPGGCSYTDLVRSLASLDGLNIIGCDLVEVCPRTIQPSAGASLAAELVRELILLAAGRCP